MALRGIKFITAEAWLTGILALLGVLGFLFLPQLVAEPKVLFGRALTAIPPSLFPALVLGSMAALALALLFTLRHALMVPEGREVDAGAWGRVVLLFAVMFFYALSMKPLGFFFSSALSMAAVAWIAGNRSAIQILAVSLISPVALYLLSTRGLAVSLPELGWVELLYARAIDAVAGAPEVSQ